MALTGLPKGQDCTSIPHTDSISCRHGKCHIETCSKGYRIDYDGSGCILDKSQDAMTGMDIYSLHDRQASAADDMEYLLSGRREFYASRQVNVKDLRSRRRGPLRWD